MRFRDWTNAITSYEAYLRYQPDDAAILVQFGHALKETGRVDEAMAAYDRAVAAAPDDEDAALHRDALRDATGRIALEPDVSAVMIADTMVAVALAAVPSNASAQFRADRARDLRDWHSAAMSYCEHLHDNLRDAPIWLQLGHMLKEMSALDEAIYAYEMAKQLDQDSSDVGVHLADLLMRVGRTSEARPLWAEMFAQKGSFFLHAR